LTAPDAPAVTIGLPAQAALQVGAPRLFAGTPRSKGEASGHIPVHISGPAIEVSAMAVLEDWNGGLARFAAFFDDLAASWRGWAGSKDLRDDGAVFSMSATHDGIGLVTLRVSAAALPYDLPGGWRITVDVPIEPGALEGIAGKVRALVT
jgi:hypothetical protein